MAQMQRMRKAGTHPCPEHAVFERGRPGRQTLLELLEGKLLQIKNELKQLACEDEDPKINERALELFDIKKAIEYRLLKLSQPGGNKPRLRKKPIADGIMDSGGNGKEIIASGTTRYGNNFLRDMTHSMKQNAILDLKRRIMELNARLNSGAEENGTEKMLLFLLKGAEKDLEIVEKTEPIKVKIPDIGELTGPKDHWRHFCLLRDENNN